MPAVAVNPSPAVSPALNPVAAPVSPFRFSDLTLDGEVLALTFGAYLLLVGFGRLLKWRLRLPRLGIFYQLFSLAFAPWVAATILAPNLPGRRELGAAAVLLGAAALVRPMDELCFRRPFERRGTSIPKFVREVAAGLWLLVAALTVVTFIYGVSVPGLLAGSSIIAVVLGFALQETLGNVIAGFALQSSQPFRTGDWLLLDGHHAQAVEINWRSSRFRTNDHVLLDVPNQHVVRATLVNYHAAPGHVHALRLDVGVDYAAAPNRVKDLLARAAAEAPHVLLEPAPEAFLKGFGDSAVIYELRFWLEEHRFYTRARDGVQTNVWYALHRAGLRIPFPTRTLQVDRPRQRIVAGDPHGTERAAAGKLLRAQSLFQGLADEHLQTLVERATFHPYGRGETIIREGAEGASMFVLLRGEAAVSVSVNDTTARVASLHRGDCFGEMSLLTGERRRASVLAVTDCEVLEITKSAFAEILARDEGLLPRLGELLAQRQLETEGVVQARTADGEGAAAARQRREEEYRRGFLTRVRAFFEL